MGNQASQSLSKEKERGKDEEKENALALLWQAQEFRWKVASFPHLQFYGWIGMLPYPAFVSPNFVNWETQSQPTRDQAIQQWIPWYQSLFQDASSSAINHPLKEYRQWIECPRTCHVAMCDKENATVAQTIILAVNSQTSELFCEIVSGVHDRELYGSHPIFSPMWDGLHTKQLVFLRSYNTNVQFHPMSEANTKSKNGFTEEDRLVQTFSKSFERSTHPAYFKIHKPWLTLGWKTLQDDTGLLQWWKSRVMFTQSSPLPDVLWLLIQEYCLWHG